MKGRLAKIELAPVAARASSCPPMTNRICSRTAHSAAPAATSSRLNPGSRRSRHTCPCGSRACAWRPWGTDRRGATPSASSSRSTTVTRSYASVSARAASNPATLPPITTACSPIVRIIHLPVSVVRREDGATD